MCDTVLSCARDHLLPLAKDHLLPLIKEAADMIRGVPKEIADMKDDLESIEDFINNEDRIADDAKEAKRKHEIKARIKQLIEASFHIEDVIDDYMICEEQPPGCAGGANLFKTMILRLQMAYKIHNIKSQINEITDTSEKDHGFQIPSSSEQGSSSSAANQNDTKLQNLKEATRYMKEADVVGFEGPRVKLVDWLVEGRAELTVVSVVGMGGQGKTTLSRIVFDNHKVVKHFADCHVWITVSQSYTKEGLLRDILNKSYKQQGEDPPQNINEMDRESLVNEVRNYLQQKRYVIVFDDVWNINFWDEIEFAMIDDNHGSKILITTRNMDVAHACQKSSFVEVLELKPLTKEKSLELFNKKAFHNLNGCCPENLINISSEIVEKCTGLPLTIVVIGGLLSTKDRKPLEWYKFSENINPELKGHARIRNILGLSYHDLPYNLKSCLLYFGLFPEDYAVDSKMLTRQWIAEGFVKEDRGKTLEEVAEGYLTELISRCLVKVELFSVDGRAQFCYVHDLVHAMILEKCEDLSFSKNISKDKQSSLTGMVRRLSIAPNSYDLMERIENSEVRSLHVYTPKALPESFVRTILTKYRRLKVLALIHDGLLEVPKDLGSLSHLKYFRFCGTFQTKDLSLPKSVGMLMNLETMDLTNLSFTAMPKEICKLRKLRHLIGYNLSLIQMKDGIGGMTSLQTLSKVNLEDGEDENDNRVVELIIELGKLKQLRELGLVGVRSKHMSAISSSINQMQQLEKLCIRADYFVPNRVIDIHLNSPPPMLQKLRLFGVFEKCPEWISKLQNLAMLQLQLDEPYLTFEIMNLLKSLPSLLSLTVCGGDYENDSKRLTFQVGSFKNLKELNLGDVKNLNYIHIEEGALCSLKKLQLYSILQLKMLPTGIQHLKLEVFRINKMSVEFLQSIATDKVPSAGVDVVEYCELFESWS